MVVKNILIGKMEFNLGKIILCLSFLFLMGFYSFDKFGLSNEIGLVFVIGLWFFCYSKDSRFEVVFL